MKAIRCTSCGASVEADQVTGGARWVTCTYCWTLLKTPPEAGAPEALRPKLPMPERFTVTEQSGTLSIVRRWYIAVAWFLVFFAMFWNGFLIVWFTMAIRSGAWGMVAFGTLHAAVGIGLIYGTLALFLNRTTIRVAEGRLTVRHAPLPWTGNVDLDTTEIRQLYCKAKVHRGKNSTTTSYEVHLVRPDERSKLLVRGLTEPEQALYLEQELERFLRIRDAPVEGELSRSR